MHPLFSRLFRITGLQQCKQFVLFEIKIPNKRSWIKNIESLMRRPKSVWIFKKIHLSSYGGSLLFSSLWNNALNDHITKSFCTDSIFSIYKSWNGSHTTLANSNFDLNSAQYNIFADSTLNSFSSVCLMKPMYILSIYYTSTVIEFIAEIYHKCMPQIEISTCQNLALFRGE